MTLQLTLACMPDVKPLTLAATPNNVINGLNDLKIYRWTGRFPEWHVSFDFSGLAVRKYLSPTANN